MTAPQSYDVDEIAVERACRGDLEVSLSRHEMAAAFHHLNDHGHSAREISQILGVTSRSVVRWRNGASPCSRDRANRLGKVAA